MIKQNEIVFGILYLLLFYDLLIFLAVFEVIEQSETLRSGHCQSVIIIERESTLEHESLVGKDLSKLELINRD